MLNIVPDMKIDTEQLSNVPERSDETIVRRVLNRIMHDFNGDTAAYFESIRPRHKTQETQLCAQQAKFAEKFARNR